VGVVVVVVGVVLCRAVVIAACAALVFHPDTPPSPTPIPTCHHNQTTAAWHLDRVEVTRLPSGPTAVFHCGRWIGGEDGSAEVRLASSPSPAAAAAAAGNPGDHQPVWYTLQVVTSDIRGAATTADVHVTLAGSSRCSERLVLPAAPTAFARGQRDEFRLQLQPLGKLQTATIGHNAQGTQPSWHLESLVVTEESSGRSWRFEGGWVCCGWGCCCQNPQAS